MANVFDQFDTSAIPAAPPAPTNVFDQFDTPENSSEPAPSMAADIAKSGGIGLAKGVIAGAGIPGDLSNLLARGSKVASDYIAGKMGFEPSPELAPPALPTSGVIQKGVENVTGDFYKPQTTPGQYAQKVGEFVGNPSTYLGPGSLAAKALTAVGGGLGSEAASQEAQKLGMTPLAQSLAPLVGAIAGGHLTTGITRVTPMIPGQRLAQVAVLKGEGIPLHAGDITGNRTLKAAESELGQGVNEAQDSAFKQAAFNRVGEVVGERPITGQNGAIDTMMHRIGNQFDSLITRNQVNADPQLLNDIQAIHRTYNDIPGLYPPETVNSVNGSLRRVLTTMQKQGGSLSGADYQTLRSNLRAGAQGASDPQRAAGLHDVTNALDDAMERTIQQTNPADAGAWARARRDYRNALVLQRWASSANMTPATLAQAAKAVYGKNAYVRGTDDFSDLAESGRNVLKQYPDSGTASRFNIERAMSNVGGALAHAISAGGGYLAGSHLMGGNEGGVGGLLLGESVGPFVLRPAARAALMNPVTQRILSNQALPYRFGTSPSMISLVNAIRGQQ